MRDPLGRYLTRWRNRVVLPHIKGRFLDIGCGLNTLVKSYTKGEGVGVDVYQWGDVDVVVLDTSKLDFATGSFQTVTLVACLNHIPNRSAVLTEARRVLEPGGRIIVTMIPPALSRVWHFLRFPWDDDQTERGMKEGEVFGLTPSEVRQLLTKSGFEIVLEQPFMFRLNRLTLAAKPVIERSPMELGRTIEQVVEGRSATFFSSRNCPNALRKRWRMAASPAF